MVPQSDNKSLNRNHTMEKMEYTSGIDPNKLSTTAAKNLVGGYSTID